jgi:hypothetical protein
MDELPRMSLETLPLYPEVEDFILMREEYVRNHDYSRHSIDDIIGIAGKPSAEQMQRAFEGRDGAIHWFYTPCYALGGITPCSYIESGKDRKEFDRVLGLLEYGEYSAL